MIQGFAYTSRYGHQKSHKEISTHGLPSPTNKYRWGQLQRSNYKWLQNINQKLKETLRKVCVLITYSNLMEQWESCTGASQQQKKEPQILSL